MQSMLVNIFVNRFSSALCWMLIHSLWQGAILGLCVAVTRALTGKWKAAARYNLLLMMFAGFLFVAALTFIWEWHHAITINATGTLATTFSNLLLVKQSLESCTAWFTAHEQVIVIVWLLIFAFKIMQLLDALQYNRHMLKRLVTKPAVQWTKTINHLCSTLQIKKVVVLLESGCMKVPVVIGHLKPVILVPLGLLASLPADQAEAILLHELAHIRRNDYLVNIFQELAKSIFFFHPAVAWVTACITEERENCCDDMAVAQTQNRRGLAEALISFKQRELYGPAYCTSFPGKKQQLLQRVSYILNNKGTSPSLPGKLFFLVAFALLFAGTITLMLVNGRQTPQPILRSTVAVSEPAAAVTENIIVPKTIASIPKKIIRPAISISIEKKQILLRNEEQEETDKEAATKEEVAKDEAEAKLDAEQSFRDQQQAMMDQVQAKKDQENALTDQANAIRKQEKAKEDLRQAMIDQKQAKLEQEKASKDYQQALSGKKEAERMKLKNQPGS